MITKAIATTIAMGITNKQTLSHDTMHIHTFLGTRLALVISQVTEIMNLWIKALFNPLSLRIFHFID